MKHFKKNDGFVPLAILTEINKKKKKNIMNIGKIPENLMFKMLDVLLRSTHNCSEFVVIGRSSTV